MLSKNRLVNTCLATLFVLSLAFDASAQNPELPALKVGSASAVGTGAASTFYSAVEPRPADLHLNNNVAVEIQALARALKNDPELIFNYVHDKIEFVPQFGLQKGALGAYVDQAGTAFDQAQLLVQLLRAANVTNVKYVIGNVTLNAQQMDDWFGSFTSDTARCRMLYDGGIPTDACGSSATITHVWVTADAGAGGVNIALDPSFKKHTEITPLIPDLKTAMDYQGRISFWSNGGGTSGLSPQAPSYSGFDQNWIKTELNRMSRKLIDEIRKPANYDASLDELIGGRRILTSLEDASQGYSGSSNALGSGTAYVEIPDSYRTILKLTFREGTNDTDIASTSFFADEIYGRRLTLEWVDNSSFGYNQSPAITGAYLKLDDEIITNVITTGALQQDAQTAFIADGQNIGIEFQLDHAYAASNGMYMDRTYRRKIGGLSQPVTFVFGIGGQTSEAMTAKLAGERLSSVSYRADGQCNTGTPPGPSDGAAGNHGIFNLADSLRAQVGYGWLSQFTGMLELQGQVSNAEITHHHSFGMVYSTANWRSSCSIYGQFGAQPAFQIMADAAMQIDVLSGISVNHMSSVNYKWATGQAAALFGSTLEGSVFEQFANKVNTASTSARFEWFNREGALGEHFYVVDQAAANALHAQSGFTSLSGRTRLQEYLADPNYIVIAPQGHNLGPGVENGSAFPVLGGLPSYDTSYEQGRAFIALNATDGEIAHIVITGKDTSKGGGAAEDESGEFYNPASVADNLRDQFEDRSRLRGVDQSTGTLSFSPPPDTSTGAGEFPYSLAFQRTYSAGGGRSRGMGVGWYHNWAINASIGGSGSEALGRTKAIRAAASLVAFTVAQDMYDIFPSNGYGVNENTIRLVVLPTFVGNWWARTIRHNVVTVRQGANTTQFYRLPSLGASVETATNIEYDPPKGSNTILRSTGGNTPSIIYNCDQQTRDANACKPIYGYGNMSLEMETPDGAVLTFDLARSPNNPNTPQLQATSWKFASDLELKFEYEPLTSSPQALRLQAVKSNLGGSSATFDGPSLIFTWNNETITAVQAKGLPAVSFAYGSGGNADGNFVQVPSPSNPAIEPQRANHPVLASVTNPAGETTEYTYVGNGLNMAAYPALAGTRNDWFSRLYEVISPEYSRPGADGLATQQFTYDQAWRVASLKDGEAVRGSRGAWDFYVAPEFRSERIAPTVNDEHGASVRPTYTVLYDHKGRAVKYTDEGGRVTTATYDGLDRVKTRTFPSGARSQFTYDAKSNVTQYVNRGRDNSARAVNAAYDDPNWVTRPTSVTDAIGNTTSITYNAPGINGAGQPALATLPTVDGQINQYSFTYNAFGQPLSQTDPEGMTTLRSYDATTGFLASVIADSGGLNLTSAFGYNTVGDLTSVDGPRVDVSDISTTTFDDARRPLEATDPVGTTSKAIYDKNGRTIRTEVRDNSGDLLQVSGKSYTATDQAYRTFSPECYNGTTLDIALEACAITTASYDSLDRPDMVTDPQGRISQTVYFESGDVARVMRAVGTPLEQAYQTYIYNSVGLLANVTDANGNKTGYNYDEYDRLARTIFPSKTTGSGAVSLIDREEYKYDGNDNLIFKRTRANDWIENQYDPLNRVTTKIVHKGSQTGPIENTVNYTYDLVGRDLLISQSGGSTADGIPIPAHKVFYGYDTAGRMLCEIQGITTDPGTCAAHDSGTHGGRKVAVSHNAAGARDSLAYPAQGSTASKTISFSYDAAGRMDEVTEGAQILANYGYDALSRKSSLGYLNGAGSGYLYHADSAIRKIVQGFTATTADVTYTFGYNKANQVTTRNISNVSYVFNGFAEEGTTDYSVNGLNQYTLTEAAPPLAQGQTVPAPETVVATSYQYDANGSLTSTGRWAYAYDAENRLVQANDTVNNNAVQFQYDGKGRRIGKLVDEGMDGTFNLVYEYLYEGDEPLADYLKVGSSFVISHRYLHGASVDERLVHWAYDLNTGAELTERFYHRDHQGSIIAMSDASGARPEGALYTYDAYGNIVTGTTQGQPFRYTGRRWDTETGLYYYRARYYSSNLGRFLQTDPIGYEDNMNLYGYVGNDPVNNTDSTGMNPAIDRRLKDLEAFRSELSPEGKKTAAVIAGGVMLAITTGGISAIAPEIGVLLTLAETPLVLSEGGPPGSGTAANTSKVARVTGTQTSRTAATAGTTNRSTPIVKPQAQITVGGEPLPTSGIPKGATNQTGIAPPLQAEVKPSPSSENPVLRLVRQAMEVFTEPNRPD